MADSNFMNPGHSWIQPLGKDMSVDLRGSSRMEELDTPMDFLGDGGSQGHSAKTRVSKKMEFLE